MKLVLTGLCLLVSILGFSQNAGKVSVDSLKARYNNQTLTFSKGYATVGENGERIRRRDMRDQFTFSPDALKEYDEAVKKRKTAIIINNIGLAFIIGGLIIHNNGSRDLAAFTLGFGEGFLISGIPISFKASKKFKHAVWLRNRDAVFH